MNKVFVVIEEDNFGSEVLGVCSTKERANELISKIELERNSCKISEDKWEEIVTDYAKLTGEEFDIVNTVPEDLVDLFPELPEEDLIKAYEVYTQLDSDICIYECDFYN